MQTFRALRVHAEGKATRAALQTLSLDELTPGEVVIRVAWSGINYKDALAVTGKGRILRALPRNAGVDCSGVVEQSSDPAYQPGDKVLVTGCNIGEVTDGGYAEFARVPAAAVVPLPPGLNLREVMAIGTAGFTAAFALKRLLENHLSPESGPVLVTGATGGVGSFAIDIFKRAGFEVAALTGKPEAAQDYLRALGADPVLDRRELVQGGKPLEPAQWSGAVDNVGGETLAWLTRTVKPWGSIASIGLVQSHELHTTVMPFILRGVSLIGIHSVECPRPWRLAIWEKLASDWKPQHIERIAQRVISLEEVPAACDAVIAGGLQGRMLVKLSGAL